MRTAEHLTALRADGALLAAAARRAGLDAPVPTCPGWRIRDLLAHIGGVHRWAASIVSSGRADPPTEDEEAALFSAPGDPALLGWFRQGHGALMDALSAADPAVGCWSFLPAPSPLAFWARRQAHETAIHRVDAETAAGGCTRCEPGFAADGVDELLTGFLARPTGRLVADPPVSLAVRASDVDAAWTVYVEPDRRRIIRGDHAADAGVRGPAHELYLLLWNRADAGRVTCTGDPAVLRLWRERATIRWS